MKSYYFVLFLKAAETYEDLRGSDLLLSKNKFRHWDDINEMFEEGILDEDTLDVLFSEVGVIEDGLTFQNFLEVVELVNQLAIMLNDGNLCNSF